MLHSQTCLFFMNGLFNDSVSSSDYITSNDRMINDIRKDLEGIGHDII